MSAPVTDAPNPIARINRTVTPDGPSAVGWSYLSAWKRCRTLGFNTYVRPHPTGGWGHTVRESPGDQRVVGSCVHAGKEAWYKNDYSLIAALTAAERKAHTYDWWPLEDRAKLVGQCCEILERDHAYCGPDGVVPEVVHFGPVARDGHGDLLVERTFEIPLAPLDSRFAGYVFTAKTDVVLVRGGALWPMDHKTCNPNTLAGTLREYRVSGQASGQLWVLRELWPTVKLGHGALVNAIIKGAGRDKPPRVVEEVPRSPLDLDVFAHHTLRELVTISALVDEWQHMVDQGADPDAAALLVFDSYPDAYTCAGKWSACDFYGACSARDTSGTWLATQTTPRLHQITTPTPHKETPTDE